MVTEPIGVYWAGVKPRKMHFAVGYIVSIRPNSTLIAGVFNDKIIVFDERTNIG